MSLRTRLIAALLALATVGLLALAAITYLEQRSFLLDRIDQQARSAVPAVSRALEKQGADFGEPPGRGPGDRPDGDVNLPPGTYGQLRSASGKVRGEVVLTYDQDSPSPPRIPSDLPTGRLITVPARNGNDLRYRVLATPTFHGAGTTVVAVPLHEVDQTLNRLLLVEALVIGGVLIALAVGAWFLVRLGLRPLERMADTAGAIAAGDLSQRVSPATHRTEVGRLGLALNGMLGRLEQAFAERRETEERLRRFLADASHELRTPLASIRGYAELFRTGAARDPANSEKAMRRIEDEAARMGVLVEDLLTLARLEEVRDRVREPVDLAAIARDAVDDARAIAPERAIALDAERGMLTGDGDQLRQVTANLLRNALVHTSAGTPVEVTLRQAARELVLEVRDHGPGLPADDADALFERFWRSERGRERGKGGAGLGLAIVAGIVEAHGGRVEG
ncbi:MAG TPA: HAMP domain-containing sensor histidine kinase, partial [Thermoleophilaceae bacterium]